MTSVIKNWSPEEDQRASMLRASGLTFFQIGKDLGRSTYSVAGRFEVLARAACAPGAGAKKRSCMCCKKPFQSTGPANRLCPPCRRIDVSPYAI